MMDVAILMVSLPSTTPEGSNRVKVKASTNSPSGTPYWRPMEMAMAKLFIRLRKAAPFLVHVDEDLADAAVLVFAGAQVDLVAADDGLLGVALAPLGQAAALADGALDDPLDDPFGDHAGARLGGCFDDGPRRVVVFVAVHQRRLEGLRQLGAVPVEGVGLEAEAPGKHVGVQAVLDGGLVGHVDGLRYGARDERLRRRHHADVAFGRQGSGCPGGPQGLAQSNTAKCASFKCGAPSRVMAPQT